MVGGWKVELSGDEKSESALIFSQDMLRILSDGTFVFYRIELEGEWEWVGDDLVLKPTRFARQSIEAMTAYMQMDSSKDGEAAVEIGEQLFAAFASPITMRVEGSDTMFQAPGMKSLDELKWVRVPDPSLHDRLEILSQSEDEHLAIYYYASIEDDIERLAPELDAILHDEEAETSLRYWAAAMLGDAKEYDVVRSLSRGLTSDERMVRAACAMGLEQHGDLAAIPAMIEAYRSNQISIYPLTELIKETGYNEATPFLLDLLTSGKDSNKRYVLGALAGLCPTSLNVKLDLVAVALHYMDSVGRSDAIRIAAARVLLAFSDYRPHRDRAFEMLTANIDADWLDRLDAVEGIFESGSPQAVPVLIEALAHSDLSVRREAAGYLAKLGAKEAVPAIERAWAEEDNKVARGVMFQALKKLRNKG